MTVSIDFPSLKPMAAMTVDIEQAENDCKIIQNKGVVPSFDAATVIRGNSTASASAHSSAGGKAPPFSSNPHHPQQQQQHVRNDPLSSPTMLR